MNINCIILETNNAQRQHTNIQHFTYTVSHISGVTLVDFLHISEVTFTKILHISGVTTPPILLPPPCSCQSWIPS